MMYSGGGFANPPIFQQQPVVRPDISGNILSIVSARTQAAVNMSPGHQVILQTIASNFQRNISQLVDNYWAKYGNSYGANPQVIDAYVRETLEGAFAQYQQQNSGYQQPQNQTSYTQPIPYQQPQQNYVQAPNPGVTYSTPTSQMTGRTAFDNLVRPIQQQSQMTMAPVPHQQQNMQNFSAPQQQQQIQQPPASTQTITTVPAPSNEEMNNNHCRWLDGMTIVPMRKSPFSYLTPDPVKNSWKEAREEAYRRINEPRYALTEEDDEMTPNTPTGDEYISFKMDVVTEKWKDRETNTDTELTVEIVEAELKAPYSSDQNAISDLRTSIAADADKPCIHVIEYDRSHVINSPSDIIVSQLNNVYSAAAPMFHDNKETIDGKSIVNVLSIIEGLPEPSRSFISRMVVSRFNQMAAITLCRPAEDFVSTPASLSFKAITNLKGLLTAGFFKDNRLAECGFGEEDEFYRAVASCFRSALMPLIDTRNRHFLNPRNDDDLPFILADERIPLRVDGMPLRMANPWRHWETVALIATSECHPPKESTGEIADISLDDKIAAATGMVERYRNRVIDACSNVTVFLERRKIIFANLIPQSHLEDPDGTFMRCFLMKNEYHKTYHDLLKRTGPCNLYLESPDGIGHHSSSVIGISLGDYVGFWNSGSLKKG